MNRSALSALLAVIPFYALAQTPGVTAKTILLGQSAAFSGPAAQLGIQMNVGTKAYLDHINAQGGVFGRRILLKTRDDQYEAKLAPETTRALIEEDKVFALISYVGTPTMQTAIPVFTQAKVPLVGPFTGAQLLREPFNRYIFNVRASYYDETEKIVNQVVLSGNKNIAVLYQNDSYGQAGLKGTEIAMAKRGLRISALGTVERNTVKVEEAVKAINAAKPDAVVMISQYTSIAEFVRQMKRAGSTTQFYNVSFVGSRALADALGEEGVGVAIAQVVPFPWDPSTAVVKEYQQVLTKAGIKDFNFSSLEGFIAAKVMVEGLKRAGKDPTREKLIAGLERMNNVNLGGFEVGFSPTNHSGSKFVYLTVIGRGGKFIR